LSGDFISLSETIQDTLYKAENMPEYLSPTNSDVFILVDENFTLSGDHVDDGYEHIDFFDTNNRWRINYIYWRDK
jgi:hypothetical protein